MNDVNRNGQLGRIEGKLTGLCGQFELLQTDTRRAFERLEKVEVQQATMQGNCNLHQSNITRAEATVEKMGEVVANVATKDDLRFAKKTLYWSLGILVFAIAIGTWIADRISAGGTP